MILGPAVVKSIVGVKGYDCDFYSVSRIEDVLSPQAEQHTSTSGNYCHESKSIGLTLELRKRVEVIGPVA